MIIEIIITIFIFALVPLAVKETSANPFTIGLFRLLLASILLGFFWRMKIDWNVWKKSSFWKLIIIGLAFFGHWITYTFSVKAAGPSICVLGMATYSIQLIFLGSWFLGHRITYKNIICLILSLIGVILVIPSWNFHDNVTFGLGLALVSASFYAVIPIMLQKSHELSQETRIFYQFFISCCCYALLWGQTSWSGLNNIDWWLLTFLAVLGTFVAHTFWSKAVTKLPTTTSGIIYYLITPLTMVLAWGITGEKLTLMQKIGGLIILMSVLVNLINKKLVNKIIGNRL